MRLFTIAYTLDSYESGVFLLRFLYIVQIVSTVLL